MEFYVIYIIGSDPLYANMLDLLGALKLVTKVSKSSTRSIFGYLSTNSSYEGNVILKLHVLLE